MRVADAVRQTSVVQRLKVGEAFTDTDGDWEVARQPAILDDEVVLWLRRYPNGQRANKYFYKLSAQVRLIRNK